MTRVVNPFLCLIALAPAAAGCFVNEPDDDDDDDRPECPPAEAFIERTDLVSDLEGVGAVRDANLINPWGLAFGPGTFFWVANAGTGTATVYDAAGRPQPADAPLIVDIGGLAADAEPTGMVFNDTPAFRITTGSAIAPSRFIFVRTDGSLAGWNPEVEPGLAVTMHTQPGAAYTGAALGKTPSAGPRLFAANFAQATVDVFDGEFAPQTLPAGAFADATLPAGYAPFNVRVIGDELWVTYALRDPAGTGEELPGPGLGYVNVFNTEGALIRRFAAQGVLDAPWGIAVAPPDFGEFGTRILIGNFGDGRISAFDRATGRFEGFLSDADGDPIEIEGLWAIEFGNGAMAGEPNALYFTAGIEDEQHGLFGALAVSTGDGGGGHDHGGDDDGDDGYF